MKTDSGKDRKTRGNYIIMLFQKTTLKMTEGIVEVCALSLLHCCFALFAAPVKHIHACGTAQNMTHDPLYSPCGMMCPFSS